MKQTQETWIEKKYSYRSKKTALNWVEHYANKCVYNERCGNAFYEKAEGGKNWHIRVYTLVEDGDVTVKQDETTQADGFWKEPTVDSRNFPKRLTEREELEEQHGQVWNTKELQQDFTVQGFASPCVVVIRKSDKTKGTLEFIHQPRFYFDFVAG